ncbi:MAG: hypothetical protein WCO60_18380 [Verrucomicrobiota bacterium]
MAISINHSAGLKFGARDVATGTTHAGLQQVTGVSVKKEFTINVEAVDDNGDTVGLLLGGEKQTISVEGYSSALDAPDPGGTISAAGITNADVTKTSVTASQSDFTKIHIEAEKYPNLS